MKRKPFKRCGHIYHGSLSLAGDTMPVIFYAADDARRRVELHLDAGDFARLVEIAAKFRGQQQTRAAVANLRAAAVQRELSAACAQGAR